MTIEEIRDKCNANNAKLVGLREAVKNAKPEELDARQAEVEAVVKDQNDLIEARKQIIMSLAPTASETGSPVIPEIKPTADELRAQKLISDKRGVIQFRDILTSTATLAKPTVVSGINDNWDAVSGIINDVAVVNAFGRNEEKVAFTKTNAVAAKGVDGQAPTPSDPTYGYVSIKPYYINVDCTVSQHIPEETPLDYEAKVKESVLMAVRRKVCDLIVSGDGTEFYGILNSVDTSATPATMTEPINIAAIDENTLRDISLNYGGPDQLIGRATLYLNKKNLIAFGKIRGADKKPLYIFTYADSGVEGTITEGGATARFVLVNSLADNKMIYGNPKCYQLDIYENVTVKISTEAKFLEGLDAIKAEAKVGGNVTRLKGFEVITIGA